MSGQLATQGGKFLTDSGKFCTSCCSGTSSCWAWLQRWLWNCNTEPHQWTVSSAPEKVVVPCDQAPNLNVDVTPCSKLTYGAVYPSQAALPDTSDAQSPLLAANDADCCTQPPPPVPGYGYWTISFFWDIGTCTGGVWSRTPGWAITPEEGLRFVPDAAAAAGWNYSPDGLACVHVGAVVLNGTAADIGEELPSDTPANPPLQLRWWYLLSCTVSATVRVGIDTTCADCYAAFSGGEANMTTASTETDAAPSVPDDSLTCDNMESSLVCGRVQYQSWVGPFCTEDEASTAGVAARDALNCV